VCAAAKNDFVHLNLESLSDEAITQALSDLSLEPKLKSADILELSDIYIRNEGSPEIWDKPKFMVAYLKYFLPLNLIRLQAIRIEAERLGFFEGIEEVIEFGSGPGTSQIALDGTLKNVPWHCIESASHARKIHQALAKSLNLSTPHFAEPDFSIPKNRLGVFSYSLCEASLPEWSQNCDSLLILEPSTQWAGRRLMELRQNLIQNGYFIWAPCTHQLDCPLFKHSNKDWCHMRTHWTQPQWFSDIEAKLPMKNDSLTYSYLLAKKSPLKIENYTRIIGDTLYEKGKSRQAICRNAEREFLAWLKRDGEGPRIPRGSLVKIPSQSLIKGNEIRPTAGHPIDVLASEDFLRKFP
jgi:ribosomal protein RSM22 (predicted rRNA methylase)